MAAAEGMVAGLGETRMSGNQHVSLADPSRVAHQTALPDRDRLDRRMLLVIAITRRW